MKNSGNVLHGILPTITVPTSVTHCAFIALRKFYSDHCLKPFCEFPNNISFSFLLQKNKATQSATIVLTLWIYRTADELQSCILVWRHSKKRCVHCNWPIVRMFGRHSCVARATAICTSWKVSEVIQRSRRNDK